MGSPEGLRSSLSWVDDHLEVIDQTELPERLVIKELRAVEDVVDAIRRLVVRGAPLIGVCGAYGMVMGLDQARPESLEQARTTIAELVDLIGSARPTAVNLGWAVRRVAVAVNATGDVDEMSNLALAEARRIQAQDREACARIAEHGRAELASRRNLLTHCNTGRLATAGVGTALGVVYAKAGAGEPVHVLACETRPLLQGARLTAWELADAGIPVTVLPDPAAGAALTGGRADAVIVGCDRVARNGDTANKVGTYPLALLARSSGIPFYVAGPMSSFDPKAKDGSAITIEERSADEVRNIAGTRIAPDVDVYNPAFDVTPAHLITAFITDVGVLRPPYEGSIPGALEEAGHAWPR